MSALPAESRSRIALRKCRLRVKRRSRSARCRSPLLPQNRTLLLADCGALLVPGDRQPLHQRCQGDVGRVAAIKDSFEDVGSEQCQSQQAADIGFVNPFRIRDLDDRGILSAFQKLSPPEMPSPAPSPSRCRSANIEGNSADRASCRRVRVRPSCRRASVSKSAPALVMVRPSLLRFGFAITRPSAPA